MQGSGGAGLTGRDDGDNEVSEDDTAKESEDEGAGMDYNSKLEMVNLLLGRLDGKSDKLANSVKELQTSLEFSQKEIDTLKMENLQLKQKLNDIDTEEKRTVYQIKKLEEKIDRVDTANKKKNLVLDGLPEMDGGKEDVDKTVWNLFDQLRINKGIELDTCYRVGPYNKNRIRPVIVTFVRQGDRDLVYSRRMELKHTAGYKRVWVNEDLGENLGKIRNMIRLIARQATADGVDCKTGTYSLVVDRKRYDEQNLDELPHRLHPTSVKQVQIDRDTIAYQSASAPFSNFYPAPITFDSCKFTCLEQAFQFIRAKTLNRPLAATQIYLSRDPVEMKRIGDDLGTSDLWESRKFDVMYV